MKIGIATVHDASNFGSYLQAYALQAILERMGHEVFFLLTCDKKYIQSLYRIPIGDRVRKPLESLRFGRFRKKKRLHFLADQTVFKVISPEEADELDLLLLGSDEIWNVRNPLFTRPVFYGINRKPPVVAYAVSAGSSMLEDFNPLLALSEAIRRLPYIAVRDERTVSICESIYGMRPPLVCDPTLLLDSNVFRRDTTKRFHITGGKYLATYLYDHGADTSFRGAVREFAKRHGLRIVSVGFYHDWVDENINCGPLDFLDVLSDAEYTVTATFHGTIFSILAHKRFVSRPTSVKTADLLNRLELGHRLIPDSVTPDLLENILVKDIDYHVVDNIIYCLRSKSLLCLQDALSIASKQD
jgi:hypothetical protein